jgi:hypothetical protein
VQKRPPPKAAAAKPTAKTAIAVRKPAASRAKGARLLQTVTAQNAAHELLDQLGVAQKQQQLLRSIDAAAARQIKRITALLDQVRTQPVANQKLQRLLTAEQWTEYLSALEQPISVADVLLQDPMPAELQRYQDMIGAADKLNGLAEAALVRSRRSGNTNAARKHRQRAEKLYEAACEYLNEQVEMADAGTELRIRAWLDRDFDYSTAGNIAIDCVGVARIRGSRSDHCLVKRKYDRAQRRTVQQECQIDALVAALQGLIYVYDATDDPAPVESSNKLRKLLALPADDLLD